MDISRGSNPANRSYLIHWFLAGLQPREMSGNMKKSKPNNYSFFGTFWLVKKKTNDSNSETIELIVQNDSNQNDSGRIFRPKRFYSEFSKLNASLKYNLQVIDRTDCKVFCAD